MYKMFAKKNHKYNAIPCESDGFKFSSKMERNYYDKIKLIQQTGKIKYFLRQVPFHLPGNVKYVVDFIVFWDDGSIHYVDVKGFDTPLSIAKRKMVEALYPIKIEIVKS